MRRRRHGYGWCSAYPAPLAAGGSEYVTRVGSMTFTVSLGRMMPGRSTQPTSPRFPHAALTSGWRALALPAAGRITRPRPMDASLPLPPPKVASSGREEAVPVGSPRAGGCRPAPGWRRPRGQHLRQLQRAGNERELLGGHQRHLPRIADGHAPAKPLTRTSADRVTPSWCLR